MLDVLNGVLPTDSDLSNALLVGMVTGDAVIAQGHSEINGMVTGDLSVSRSASVVIRGTVSYTSCSRSSPHVLNLMFSKKDSKGGCLVIAY